MKKISSPHKNNFINNELPNYDNISEEEISKMVEDFWEENKMNFPVKVSDLGNGMVEIRAKGVFGRFPKQIWNDALLEEGKKNLPL